MLVRLVNRKTTALRPFNAGRQAAFFIDAASFISGFAYFQVNYLTDSWSTNYYERKNDDGSKRSYTFTLARS